MFRGLHFSGRRVSWRRTREGRRRRLQGDDMRLAVTFLGLDLFSIDLTTAEADDDYSRDPERRDVGQRRTGPRQPGSIHGLHERPRGR